jgi:ABC-type Mn2+/Zn2+ transport system ATPase subunit
MPPAASPDRSVTTQDSDMAEWQARSMAHAVHSAQAPRLRTGNLIVGYADVPLVAEVTLELQRGDALALIGMNGSGKSTLLKTVMGLLPPIGGEIEVVEAAPGKASGRIAYLSQAHESALMLPLRAIDVVRMGRFSELGLFNQMRAPDHALVKAAMEAMGITDLIDAPLRSLSGGQQQRVYLAQVLAHRGDLLVLDEPTAGLDAAGKKLYEQAIAAERQRGAAVLVATHDIQEAFRCGQAMLLARRVIAFGNARDVLTPATLLATFGIVLTPDGVGSGFEAPEGGGIWQHGTAHAGPQEWPTPSSLDAWPPT